MNLKQLPYFIAIAEEGSVTRAADRFWLSQPSMSHHLAAAYPGAPGGGIE